jgi:hypothetical protein
MPGLHDWPVSGPSLPRQVLVSKCFQPARVLIGTDPGRKRF